jgi:hypothetical protein
MSKPDPLTDLLRAMSDEHLLTFRHRLELLKKKEIASLLTEEINRRKANPVEVSEVDRAILDNARQKATTMSFDHWLGNSEH